MILGPFEKNNFFVDGPDPLVVATMMAAATMRGGHWCQCEDVTISRNKVMSHKWQQQLRWWVRGCSGSCVCGQEACCRRQYHSSRCWLTIIKADEIYKKLGSEGKQLKAIKEQLLMRSLGLGWNEAYHAWSKDGIPFTSNQLF